MKKSRSVALTLLDMHDVATAPVLSRSALLTHSGPVDSSHHLS